MGVLAPYIISTDAAFGAAPTLGNGASPDSPPGFFFFFKQPHQRRGQVPFTAHVGEVQFLLSSQGTTGRSSSLSGEVKFLSACLAGRRNS